MIDASFTWVTVSLLWTKAATPVLILPIVRRLDISSSTLTLRQHYDRYYEKTPWLSQLSDLFSCFLFVFNSSMPT